MSPTSRLVLFGISVVILLPMMLAGLLGLPEFGEPRHSYGQAIAKAALDERHVTNLVSAVVFDYRGLDTLGEEFIMFAAVAGILLLLRGGRGRTGLEPAIETRARSASRRSDATTAFGRWLLGVLALFGLYVMAHGHLTPGGGFQAGVMIAGAFLLVYLTDGYALWHRWTPNAVLDCAEGASAAAFVVIGFAPWLVGAGFLANVLPLGRAGELLSGGAIPLLNLFVGIGVAAAFVLLFAEFLQETRRLEPGEDE
jgi:multicomponent Na+:H+ antiporter subunit B